MAQSGSKGSMSNPYTMSEYESMADAGTWQGGYVKDDNGTVTYMMKDLIVTGYSSGSYKSGSSSGDYQFASYTSFSGDPSLNEDEDGDGDDSYGNGGGTGSSGGSGGSGNSGNGGSGNNNSGVSNPENDGESDSHIIYSLTEALMLMNANQWNGGYVAGLGYVMPQITVLPSSNQDVLNGTEVLNRALSFSGVPYKYGGIDMTGIDCSGLVSAALNIDRWTTGGGDVPTTNRVDLNSSNASFVNDLQVGDILVWRWKDKYGDEHGHCCIYAGEGKIFHAHGATGTPTGYTHDLITYWYDKHGVPKVYRK